MLKFITGIVMAFLLAMTGWSQDRPADQAEQQEQTQNADSGVDEDASTDEGQPDTADIDDSELDDQTYEGDDSVFIPTEEVPVDEPIPFPTNI